MSGTEYVVLATQLNRVDDKGNPAEPLKRGDTFGKGDVTGDELDRWEQMDSPRVIIDKGELDKAQQAQADARAENEKLRAELADKDAELASLRAAGPDIPEGLNAGPEQPSGNASREEWAAYASATDPDNAGWINDEETTRNDLRDKYRT